MTEKNKIGLLFRLNFVILLDFMFPSIQLCTCFHSCYSHLALWQRGLFVFLCQHVVRCCEQPEVIGVLACL